VISQWGEKHLHTAWGKSLISDFALATFFEWILWIIDLFARFVGNDDATVPRFQVFSRFHNVIEISSRSWFVSMLLQINCPWWKILSASLS